MNPDTTFEITENELIRKIPNLFQYGENIYSIDTIMTKDIFVKCYKKWILGEDNDTDDHK